MPTSVPKIAALAGKLHKNPFVMNTFLLLILVAFEKFVEVEFECPCSQTWKMINLILYFVSPATASFVLSLSIQNKCSCKSFWSSLLLALTWVILLFLDGRYLACVSTDTNEPIYGATIFDIGQRLCNNSSADTHSKSQFIGLVMTLALSLLYGGYVWCRLCGLKCCKLCEGCCIQCCEKTCRENCTDCRNGFTDWIKKPCQENDEDNPNRPQKKCSNRCKACCQCCQGCFIMWCENEQPSLDESEDIKETDKGQASGTGPDPEIGRRSSHKYQAVYKTENENVCGDNEESNPQPGGSSEISERIPLQKGVIRETKM